MDQLRVSPTVQVLGGVITVALMTEEDGKHAERIGFRCEKRTVAAIAL